MASSAEITNSPICPDRLTCLSINNVRKQLLKHNQIKKKPTTNSRDLLLPDEAFLLKPNNIQSIHFPCLVQVSRTPNLYCSGTWPICPLPDECWAPLQFSSPSNFVQLLSFTKITKTMTKLVQSRLQIRKKKQLIQTNHRVYLWFSNQLNNFCFRGSTLVDCFLFTLFQWLRKHQINSISDQN